MRIVLANEVGAPGVEAAAASLEAGLPLLDAVEAGIRPVEADPGTRWVGVGGDPNVLGTVECDASIMLGSTRQAGAVGALRGYRHAISVARQVLERSPHVFLVGDGAGRFAAEVGAEPAEMLSRDAARRYVDWCATRPEIGGPGALERGPLLPLVWRAAYDVLEKDTTVLLLSDGSGRLAGGASTSGWAYKYPGRVGDSPVIGAGLYVDDRYGAAACTHTGEMTIRAGTARSVVAHMARGASVRDACMEALDDLARLEGGFLGPVVVHAIDPSGHHFVAATTPNARYCAWTGDGTILRGADLVLPANREGV